MTGLTLGLVVALAVPVLWLTYEVIHIRRRISVVPAEGGIYAALQNIDNDLAAVEETVSDLAPRLAALEAQFPRTIQRTAVVTYDAFGNIAGDLSRSIALLTGQGDGVVISLLVGRDETRFFTKMVQAGRGVDELSPEEQQAVRQAMAG